MNPNILELPNLAMAREWAPFAYALDGTSLQAFAWIYDPRTKDIRSAATNNMQFPEVVRQMAFLLAIAGKNAKEREKIRALFLKQYDHYCKGLNVKM